MSPYFETGDGEQRFAHQSVSPEIQRATVLNPNRNNPDSVLWEKASETHRQAQRYAAANRVAVEEKPDEQGGPCAVFHQRYEFPHIVTDQTAIAARLAR